MVDFYSGNTFSDPGPENCEPKTCGGALIQFSEPVLVFGNPAIDILGKGIIECIEGCSNTEPSPYIILSGTAWIEAGDTIVQSRIIQVDGAFITDVAGNQIDSYDLNPAITARVSDFAMVQGPTPIPTPVPSSNPSEFPYVRHLEYDGTTVHLHISEPVKVQAESFSDIAINVVLENGTPVIGDCFAPCDGSDALLSFEVPGLSAGAIPTSFVIAQEASIRDEDGQDIYESLEEIVDFLIPRIVTVEMQPAEASGRWNPIGLINIYFSQEVWIDATELNLTTNTDVVIPCDGCFYGPGGKNNLLIFGWPLGEHESAPPINRGDVIDALIPGESIIGVNGMRANTNINHTVQ